MKHVILLAAVWMLIACNNNKKPGEITVKSEDGKTTATVDASSAAQAADAMQKKVEELQKLSAYTLDQMKAFYQRSSREQSDQNSLRTAQWVPLTLKAVIP
jgi:hypothetical protein